jgi:hypothetical protein
MKRLLVAAALVVCFSAAAHAESKRGPWLRRLTLAALCASSLWDLQTTCIAVGYGAQEANSLFVNRNGDPRWGRMLGVKVGLCTGMAVGQEVLDRSHRSATAEYAWSGVNTAFAIRYSSAAVHNVRVADQMKRRPEYLLRRY